MLKSILIGTRGSPLALAQSGLIRDQLAQAWPEQTFELVIISTTGDQMQTSAFKPAESTKAIFTKEIEEALLDEQIDLAIHSAKDLAATMPEGLCLGAVPLRASPSDVLVLKPECSLTDAERGVILTSSARRQRQWLDFHPDSTIEPVRGNIDTRLRKLISHPKACGLLLAEAGLQRLKPDLLDCAVHSLDPFTFIPAPGQGTLALQCRSKDKHILALLKALEHPASASLLKAERSFLLAMNAGCSVPLGAYAWTENNLLHLKAVFYPDAQSSAIHHQLSGDLEKPEALGTELSLLYKNSTAS